MNPTVLAQLKVTDFFQNSNWYGQLELEQVSQKAIDPVAQLRLNLKEFFSQNNWSGSRNLIQLKPNPTIQDLSLMTVQAYFQCQVWSGQPAIAVVPHVKNEESKTQTVQTFQITDLSNLF